MAWTMHCMQMVAWCHKVQNFQCSWRWQDSTNQHLRGVNQWRVFEGEYTTIVTMVRLHCTLIGIGSASACPRTQEYQLPGNRTIAIMKPSEKESPLWSVVVSEQRIHIQYRSTQNAANWSLSKNYCPLDRRCHSEILFSLK